MEVSSPMFRVYNYFRQYNSNKDILDYKSFYRYFSNDREFGGGFLHIDHLVKNRFMNVFGHIVNTVLRKQPKNILDMGCGAGVNLPLSNLFPNINYHGIDYAEKTIKTASKIYPHVTFRVMDAFNLNFEDNAFDMVILSSVLILYEKEEDRIKLLKQAFRVLKPNGLLVCVIWKDSFILKSAIRISRFLAKINSINVPIDFHGLLFSPADAKSMFSKTDFHLEEHMHTASLYGVLESVRYLTLKKYRRTFGNAESEGQSEHPQKISEDMIRMSGAPFVTKVFLLIEKFFPNLFSMFSIYILRK